MMNKQKKISPLARKICACGCGHEFQPGRKDQIFLNSNHANHDYNRRRKKKNALKQEVKNLLNQNNELLKDLYRLTQHMEDSRLTYKAIQDMGYEPDIFRSIAKYKDKTCYYQFEYLLEVNINTKECKIIKL